MIKLENITTERLMYCAYRSRNIDKIMERIYELFVAYDIQDYQRLKDLLDSKNPEFQCVSSYLNRELFEVEQNIKNANLLGLEPTIFTFENYKKSNIDDKTLSITDRENKGNVLLYSCPMTRGGARINQLKYLSIEDIKHLSSHLSRYKLENAFTFKRNFGIDTVKRVVDMVKFYEEQVLRQATETQEREINLFMLNKKEKDEIVESEIKEIVEYLIDNAEKCIWGNLSSSKKMQMARAVLAVRGEYVLQDRRMLIDAISNYTTLGELEQGVVKKRTLDRFIVK